MLTPQSFFYKYNEKPINFDGRFGNQCVDVIQQYNKDIHNGAFLYGDTALDIWNGVTPPQYEKILNTPTNYPMAGDIIFFSYNHTSMVVLADVNSITSFDQNYPIPSTGDGTGVCRFQEHDYGPFNNPTVLGWWTPRK
jgi:hypothetical protein